MALVGGLENSHGLIELLDVGVLLYRADGTLEYANAAACELLNITREEMVAGSHEVDWDIVDLDGKRLPHDEQPFLRVLRDGQPIKEILGVVDARQSRRLWLRVSAMPLADGTGVLQRVVVSFTDVSIELGKRADSERLFGTVLGAMNEGVVVHDRGGAILYSNAAAQRILGLTQDQMVGLAGIDPRWALVTPQGEPVAPAHVPSEITGRTGQPCRNVPLGVHRANGERAWLSVSTDPLGGVGDTSHGVVATFLDVTAHREAELAAERANAKLSLATSLMPCVIYQYLVRDDGTDAFPFAAGRTVEIMGRTVDEIVGDAEGTWSAVHPDDVAAVREAAVRAAATMTRFIAEARFNTNAGWRWARANATPARVDGGVMFTGVVLDINEERTLADAMRKTQRREVMGELAAGVAHNFNNMLAATLPNLEWVLSTGVPAEAVSALTDAIDATSRATELVRQLMQVAHGRPELAPDPLELAGVIDEVVRLCRRTFDSGIAITVDVAPSARTMTFGHASQVHQVILNLCLNARDAMAGRSDRALHIELDEQQGPVPGQGVGDSHLVLSIRDTGSGMDEATLARLGEPFFTTKPPGKGTGLGIASVMATVRDMGGHVEVSSTPDVGTTFRLHLPMYVGRRRTAATSDPAAPLKVGRVLIVEDEPLVRRSVERLLAKYCQATTAVETAAGALSILDERRGEFDLVLLDLSMPGMSGRELLARVHAKWPRLPVVVMSGDTSDREGLESAMDVLEKPLPLDRLRAALARAVGR